MNVRFVGLGKRLLHVAGSLLWGIRRWWTSKRYWSLPRFARQLGKYSPSEVIAAAGALQLIPKNADCTIRLEVLASIAASLREYEGSRPLSIDGLRKLCNSPPLSQGPVAWAEDPFENPFTEAFVFHGGSYTVFPGVAEDQVYTLRHLARAIFLHETPFPNQNFRREANALLTAVLVLSSEIARRSGLRWGTPTISNSERIVDVPDEVLYSRLVNSVTYSADEFRELFREEDTLSAALARLTCELGSVDIDSYGIREGPLLAKPIIRTARGYIVALPGALVSALRHEILRLAREEAVEEELGRRYSSSVWLEARESLQFLRCDPLFSRAFKSPSAFGFEAVFRLDTDKAIFALLITDAFVEYDPNEPFAEWNGPELEDLVLLKLDEAQQFLYCRPQGAPNGVLFLVLIQGVGRHFGLGIPVDPHIRAPCF